MAADTITTDNRSSSHNALKLALFALLVVVTVFLAARVSNIAAEVTSSPIPATIPRSWVDVQEDPLNHLEIFCYKSCSFIR